MRWQMALYKEMAGKAEDAEDPEKVVKRVQEVSAVLYHIEVVSRRHKPKSSASKDIFNNIFKLYTSAFVNIFMNNLFSGHFFHAIDRASLQIKENGVAQAAV